MALHDGLVNWPLFFGSILIGFGPLAALFFVVVAKRAQLVIIALSGAFLWLVAILVTATCWQLLPPLKTSLPATIVVAVVVQEAFRLLFFYLYTRTEAAVKRVTTAAHQLPLNDVTSALAGGVGFSLMHALLMFGSLVGSSTGARGAAFSLSCESVPLVLSAAFSTLALTAMDVTLMIVAFEGYRKRSVLASATVFVLHMGVALSALANMDTNGCYVSIPLHYAGAALACACATTTVWRSKKLAVDAK
uniref:Gamma-secretase subunit Aph-1 n=1 Tax=Peronospora matthiolae TaxID=2874970 RepID=A0AAV1VNC2_9STRA